MLELALFSVTTLLKLISCYDSNWVVDNLHGLQGVRNFGQFTPERTERKREALAAEESLSQLSPETNT